ncbi:HAD-IA family hydrolase [Hyphococcus luteus]|uniref:phosphoglycolate phosphatase n=1 Tax=Hyphococcus luteus TaxID=2058213 RepID=A0A2S7KB27_9PROT|nr:HAD-IA family hydrolase [Marinicaulis flavus]PQA89649.1 phosphoglycolate phosphatase [Marinicaulis flavus]
MAEDLRGSALIFDLDGTLVDTVEDLSASMNHVLAAAGLAPVPTGEVRHLVGHGARRMLMRGFLLSAGREAQEGELDDAMTRFLDFYGENIAVHSRPFDHVIEMTEGFLARGARAAICTNKREAMARRLIETLGVAPLFDAIVGADTAEAAKPDPAPVRLCLQEIGAARAAFIGDSDTDIRAAGAAGLPCFVADFGYGPVTLADRAAVFSSYREAAPLIEAALKG